MARRTMKTVGQPGSNRRAGGAATPSPPPTPAPPQTGGVRPWHLLVLGAVTSAAAGAVVTRDGGIVQTVAVIVTILTAGLVAAGLVRTLGPLVATDAGEETEMLAGRTRAALEREKMLVLRSIKEVEFDRAMRKISDADYGEIVPRLRTRAVGLIRQLEGGGGYRALIERDLAALVPPPTPATAPSAAVGTTGADDRPAAVPTPAGTCPGCRTLNDRDARFCKSCGTRIAVDV